MFLTRRKWLVWSTVTFLSALLIIILKPRFFPSSNPRSALNLEQRIEITWKIARYKLTNTIDYLSHRVQPGVRYPYLTYNRRFNDFWHDVFHKHNGLPQGAWKYDKAKFWAAGAFPALLWKMSGHESDPVMKKYWANEAKNWSEPLRKLVSKKQDITLNNLLVFEPWFTDTTGAEKQQQLETIFQGARLLAEPFNQGKGKFHLEIGTLGYKLKSKRKKLIYWQSFIDHSINVEQLLWSANYNPNKIEAEDWRNKAISHLKTLGKTLGKNRNPGVDGTWQRGYFDDNPTSSTYGQFLFNEGKQGWKDDSTWSRGQAWFIYASSITYQYTQDLEVLAIAKESINYFLSHLPDRFPGTLRRPNDYIPPWDFDYALEKNPDTEKDSSAAAIAVSGVLKLLKILPHSDPDWERYWQDVKNILFNLTSLEYLPDLGVPQMSLLSHGCYHHFDAIKSSKDYDNGLIWGDYFLIDSLIEYETINHSLMTLPILKQQN